MWTVAGVALVTAAIVPAWLEAQRIPDMDTRWEARKPKFDVAPEGEAGRLVIVLRRRR